MRKVLEASERRKRRDPEIKVWDRFVRIHHWLLVLAFATLYFESKKFPLHPYAGYLICILLPMRIFWGFKAKGAARFSSFLYSPRETLAYFLEALRGKASYYYSHNPLGAAMVYALIASLGATCLLGLLAYSASQQLGPFGARVPADWEDILIEWHSRCGHAVALLVCGHLFGVLWAARLHRENYVLAMLTGLRRIPRAIPLPPGASHPEAPKDESLFRQKIMNWLNFKWPFVGTLILMGLLALGFLLPIIHFLTGLNKILPAY
ncbi:MAG: putative cytochrome b561 [Proteobacteria bacterium]|nr:putative cytochrome b561 [Pseudomonadota bacterium]